MTQAIDRDPIYRGRRFQTETIELSVRWYITYQLSYRDLVAMMAERGIIVSHTTVMRWVQRYVPEYKNRWARFAQPVNASWRMHETAVSVLGGLHPWRYNYRFKRKHKTIALGVYPDVVLARARARHQVARQFLADGIDPAAEKEAACASFGLSEDLQARQFAQLFYSGGAPHAGRQCDDSDVPAKERDAKLAV